MQDNNFNKSGNTIKKIALIGSTGSIGRQTVQVVSAHPDRFKIVAIAANRNSEEFLRQVKELKPCCYAAAEQDGQAALDIASFTDADIVVVACGGFAGLKYSLAAANAGKTLALANKETLVCGGELIIPLAEQKGVDILPIDSEHSAIWQCLGYDRKKPFKRLIITASGGPFRGYTKEQLERVTPEKALCHPTWNMGAKITIDSATMLNKGFEVIEAHHLYGAEYGAITAVIHPQSIVHSMVEFADGAVLAQLSEPTMHLPIQAALCYPERLACSYVQPMDFTKALSLEFLPIERGMYPCYDIALQCGRAGGTAPAILNAASETAVGLFLQNKLPFTGIYAVINDVLSGTPQAEINGYGGIAAADTLARQRALAAAQKYKR
ncbi:MAG: 1-deoxy-D-xylulose-5-phosphate reductoisomerase [Clostridia bacterium]|nr:1-deoxy-D-xylulose-5-phosphate reductoisomerase [Clostridia bacterium]